LESTSLILDLFVERLFHRHPILIRVVIWDWVACGERMVEEVHDKGGSWVSLPGIACLKEPRACLAELLPRFSTIQATNAYPGH
jgi:hypothetical protein